MSSFHEEALWAAARTHGVSLFGAGRFARDVAAALAARGVRVHGFLVSGVPGQPTLDDLPVRQITAENLAESPVWVGVFNREAHSDYAALATLLLGVQPEAQLVWPQAYYGALAEALGFRFWLQPLAAYQQPGVQDAIAQARELLADAPSRQAFDAVLAFRTDPQRFMCPPQPQDEVQYLPTWLRQTLAERGVESLRLVDGGAYRGETVRELGALIPIAQAWTFEPDAENYAHLVRNLADWPTPITHIPAGLSDTAGFAAFTPGMGEASALGGTGTHRVPVVGLDECLHQAKINFIKFDLEGHEIPALLGSRQAFLRQRPVASIAGYHRWDDLWRIPFVLQDFGLEYQIHLGLHAHNTFDAVFYAE